MGKIFTKDVGKSHSSLSKHLIQRKRFCDGGELVWVASRALMTEEEKRQVWAVVSNSSPCQEAWAVPCVPFLNAHPARVSQIQTREGRVSAGMPLSRSPPVSWHSAGRRSPESEYESKPSITGKPCVRSFGMGLPLLWHLSVAVHRG